MTRKEIKYVKAHLGISQIRSTSNKCNSALIYTATTLLIHVINDVREFVFSMLTEFHAEDCWAIKSASTKDKMHQGSNYRINFSLNTTLFFTYDIIQSIYKSAVEKN